MRNRSPQVIAPVLLTGKASAVSIWIYPCWQFQTSCPSMEIEMPSHAQIKCHSIISEVNWQDIIGSKHALNLFVLGWSRYRWRTFIFTGQSTSTACNGR